MKKIKNKLFKLGSVALVLSTIISCSDDVLDEPTDTNSIPVELFDTREDLIDAGLQGIYKPLQSQGLYGRWLYFLQDYTSDEVQVSIPQPPIQTIADYRLNNDSEATNKYWESCFAGIRSANIIISSLGSIDDPSDATLALIAEARFLRGHYYFLLTTRFGGVPLNLADEGSNLRRSTFAESMQVVIDDFTFAADNLNETSDSATTPNKEVAAAYLGKALLFSIEPGDFGNKPEIYDQAFEALNRVQSYSLVANYDDNFNVNGEGNAESLFEVEFTSNLDISETQFWAANIPRGRSDITMRSVEYSSWGNGSPSNELKAAYETNADGELDPRLAATFWFPGAEFANGTRVWGTDADANNPEFGAPAAGTECTRKFSEYIENDGSLVGSGINFRILRFADVLLLKAEAALYKTNSDMGMAINLMNEVRSRPSVDMPAYPTDDFPCSNINETFEALVHERRIELAMEGKRTIDLGRWGLDFEVLAPIRQGYNSNRRFFPIPNIELNTNTNFGDDNPQ